MQQEDEVGDVEDGDNIMARMGTVGEAWRRWIAATVTPLERYSTVLYPNTIVRASLAIEHAGQATFQGGKFGVRCRNVAATSTLLGKGNVPKIPRYIPRQPSGLEAPGGLQALGFHCRMSSPPPG